MQLVPPGPDRDRLVAAAQASVDAQREQLFDRVPVIGLASPHLDSAALLEFHSGSEELAVVLGYGERRVAQGPFVSVRTGMLGATHEPSLADLLADERDRIFDQGGVDEPEPVDVTTEPGLLSVGDRALPARVRHERQLWVARAELPLALCAAGVAAGRGVVSVVSRGVPASALRLTLITELAPLWAARERWLADEAERYALRPETEPPPVDGIRAHEALIDSIVGQRLAHQAGELRRRYPRRAADERDREWEAALQTQIRLGGQSHEQANRAVAQMVNQLSELAASVDWWPVYGPDAIAETIRYTLFDSDVASRPAQLLWAQIFLDVAAGRDQWLSLWQQWQRERVSDRR